MACCNALKRHSSCEVIIDELRYRNAPGEKKWISMRNDLQDLCGPWAV